ncbi:AraC family transcriptional regulator [Paenibacillus sp. H1-7]|uniref:helix-turn-helix transcriptional regulator n=1 Tax=Paenibacillus sp. H1-7 TaxID=2282849 RepID=UPI001EF9A8ED|nr:AraC family transcriptional regulator [Paenibacillus sp. H1-7]ULL15870.1 AraC family transcriptional regulator [Paenibacillus sp. H1-7]
MTMEKKRLLRDAQLTMLKVARNDYQEQEAIPTHQTGDYHQLIVVHRGSGKLIVNDRHYPVISKYFYLLPPHSRHTLDFTDAAIMMTFKFKLCDEGLEHALQSYPAHGCCGSDDWADLKQWFQLSVEYSKTPEPLTLYRIDSGFKGTLLSLLQGSRMEFEQPKDTQRARTGAHSNFPIAAYISNHLSERLSLVDIASHFGFHPHYIIKICNDHIGMSPMQYLQELRLEKAMEYLQDTDLTVSEISEKLGWTTSYFSRLFHQKKGMSPSQFRKDASYRMMATDISLSNEHAAAGQ